MSQRILFNSKKFEVVLHYLIERCAGKPNVGKTVLFKLLYFADFDHYELYEEPLTGERYRHIRHGPAPSHFDKLIERMIRRGRIKREKLNYYGMKQERFINLEECSKEQLTGREIEVLEKVIARFADKNAVEIAWIANEDMPCKATPQNESINYELVFYREPIYSVREYPPEADALSGAV